MAFIAEHIGDEDFGEAVRQALGRSVAERIRLELGRAAKGKRAWRAVELGRARDVRLIEEAIADISEE